MHITLPTVTLPKGLALAAAAGVLALCAACGSSSSAPTTGSSGSGTVAAAPAAHQATKPPVPAKTTAPATQPATAPNTSVSIAKDIVVGNVSACTVVNRAQIAAIIGPITRERNSQSNTDCELTSATSIATINFATPNYWPSAVTSVFSNPLTPSPCPNDLNGVYGTSSAQYVTGAFCSNRSYGLQVEIAPVGNDANNGPAQIHGVYTITVTILGTYKS
jgi:hypothetical protein